MTCQDTTERGPGDRDPEQVAAGAIAARIQKQRDRMAQLSSDSVGGVPREEAEGAEAGGADDVGVDLCHRPMRHPRTGGPRNSLHRPWSRRSRH